MAREDGLLSISCSCTLTTADAAPSNIPRPGETHEQRSERALHNARSKAEQICKPTEKTHQNEEKNEQWSERGRVLNALRRNVTPPIPTNRALKESIGSMLDAVVPLLPVLPHCPMILLSSLGLHVHGHRRVVRHVQLLRITAASHHHVQLHAQRPQVALLRRGEVLLLDLRHHRQRRVHLAHSRQCQHHLAVRLRRGRQALQLHLAHGLRRLLHALVAAVHRDQLVVRVRVGLHTVLLHITTPPRAHRH